MALGRRCDTGCESWPDSDRYKTCPVCGEEATRFKNLQPLTQQEANQREFELYYERWNEQHDPARLAGDAPDARGRFAPLGTVGPPFVPALLDPPAGPAS